MLCRLYAKISSSRGDDDDNDDDNDDGVDKNDGALKGFLGEFVESIRRLGFDPFPEKEPQRCYLFSLSEQSDFVLT